MDAIRQLFEDNLRRQGLLDETPESVVQTPTRTVDKQQPTVAPVAARPAPIVVRPTVVKDDRVDDLEARVKKLEDMLRPVLAEKPMAEIDKIALEYASLSGKTELTYHQYRCLKRTARQQLLAVAGAA